jgi:uncharacterized alkaline shock family protein YloU
MKQNKKKKNRKIYVYLSYTFVIFVVGREILLHIMSELTGTMVGFDILSINVYVVYF